MAQLFSRIKTRRFGILALIVIGLGIISGVVLGKTKRAKLVEQIVQSGPNVVSSTPAIRVVSVNNEASSEGSLLTISLQNLSSKSIKAYSIGSGKAWYTKSYLFEETVFAPNNVDTSIVPLNRLSSSTGKDLVVTGVLFEDGSADGQATPVQRLIQTYQGVKAQANRLKGCLQQLSQTSVVQDSALSRCENDVASLPLKEGTTDYQEGLRNAQLLFSTHLKELKDMVRANRSDEAVQKKRSVIRVFQNLGQSVQ